MKICNHCQARAAAADQVCSACGARLNDLESGLSGITLANKYLLEARLGCGGMCEVYQASHVPMGKQVAIKVLRPALAADAAISRRFELEARAASRIHHPNAINVTDYGIDEHDIPYIVMDLVHGETLGELLRREGAFSVERTAHILQQICGALEAAHAAGVVHRDIKPDNIIIAEYEGRDWVQVVDFGVAKVQEDLQRRGALTGENIIVGTPRYMSPEQAEEKPVDRRSDIYSVGVVLYEVLAGETPFAGDSSTRLLIAHATEPPPPLSGKRPGLNPEIEALVMQTLAKDPAQRPRSARELAQAFAKAAGMDPVAPADSYERQAFSRICIPLGREAAGALPDDRGPGALDDEATLVARKPALGLAGASMDSGGADVPAASPARYDATPVQTAYYASPRIDGERSYGWLVLAIGFLLLAAGLGVWLIVSNHFDGGDVTSAAINDAQQSLSTAVGLVDALPKDHPLRTYLTQLKEWQTEMNGYQRAKAYNGDILRRSRQYRQKADDLAGQARVALAAMVKQSNSNAAPSRGLLEPGKDSAGPPRGAAEPDAGSAADPSDDSEKPKGAAGSDRGANRNAARPRRIDPPVIPPLVPDPRETEPPPDSARPKRQRPPEPKNGNLDMSDKLQFVAPWAVDETKEIEAA